MHRTAKWRLRSKAAPRCLAMLLIQAPLWGTAAVRAQQPGLEQVRAMAREAHPAIAAARATLDAAMALERQAHAFPNPSLLYSREQTGSATQDVAALEQRLELGARRTARAEAARLRREAAAARLAFAEAELDAEVARRIAAVNAARRRVELAGAAAEQFRLAVTVIGRRLQAGDASGYEARRIRLESARYEAMAAQARLLEREALLRLQELAATETLGIEPPALHAVSAEVLSLSADSVVVLAASRNGEIRSAMLEAAAVAADARLVRQERVPLPALTAGLLRQTEERVTPATGFVAGISMPLPLWDRRDAAVDAAVANARRAQAELAALRRRVERETRAALEAVRQSDLQVSTLQEALGPEAVAALRAAETAYAEGEITLLGWLDAVRAYQEAESAYAAVLAESFLQRATLERLLGSALIR